VGVSVGTKKGASATNTAPITDVNDRKQLEQLVKRLLAYARRFASVMTWWLGNGGALAKGNTVEDVVQKAIVSLFGEVESRGAGETGTRRWDPTKYPEPWVYLMLFVKTELRNLAVSSENRFSDRDVGDDALTTSDTIETLLVEAEFETEHEQRVQRTYSLLVDEIGADKELQKLHDEMMSGAIKPKELAGRMSMSVKDVNNLKKRMYNAAKRALARLQKETNS
jgi:hypothetical protein